MISAATTAVVAPALAWITGPDRVSTDDAAFPIRKTDAEWKSTLTHDQYRVLRHHATERPFSSPLDHLTRRGTYVCAGCAAPLFSSDTKFDSGTGWPSFWKPIDAAVSSRVDYSWLMVRTEIHCAHCGGHLGHLFADGPPPTGLRYCINGAALVFRTAA
jgi:peptide-methionine (R)-S-oxide reductase